MTTWLWHCICESEWSRPVHSEEQGVLQAPGLSVGCNLKNGDTFAGPQWGHEASSPLLHGQALSQGQGCGVGPGGQGQGPPSKRTNAWEHWGRPPRLPLLSPFCSYRHTPRHMGGQRPWGSLASVCPGGLLPISPVHPPAVSIPGTPPGPPPVRLQSGVECW